MENLLNNTWAIVLIFLFTVPLKGLALWRSARKSQLGWFVVLLIVNTLAILDIIYLIFFSGKDKQVEETDDVLKSGPVVRNKYTERYREVLESERIKVNEKPPVKTIKKIM